MILRISRRVRSRTRTLVAFLPLGMVVSFLFAANVFMDAQTLTGDQEASAALGDATAQLTLFDVELPLGTTTGDDLRDEIRRIDSEVETAIGAINFPYYAGGARGIFYREKDWAVSPPDPQYRLVDGRWPADPGEIAIIGERAGTTKLGYRVPTLGGGQPLVVVGIGQPRLTGSPTLLAAPGTWASLERLSRRSDITGFPIFDLLANGGRHELAATVTTGLAEQGLDSPSAEEPGGLARKVQTRADIAEEEAARPWSEQSPLSLLVPGLILVPTTVMIGYLILARRLTVTARRMVAQGVRTRVAITGLWLVPLPTIAVLAVASAIVGTVLGVGLARFGVDRWGYHVANWIFPDTALGLSVAGCLVALPLAWPVMRARVGSAGGAKPSRRSEKVRDLTLWRHGLAGVAACVALWQALTLDSGSDGVLLTSASINAVALLGPELVRTTKRLMPEHTLSQRLVSRQIAHHEHRFAIAATTFIALVAVSVGFLIVLTSTVQELRTRHPSAPPAGHVLVDNGGATFLSVDPEVKAVLESVPALRDQEPVQFYLLGTRYLSKVGITEVRRGIGTPDFPAVSYALASVDDVETAYGRALTTAERAALTGGGVLVPRPDRVSVRNGQVALVDIGTLQPVKQIDALVAEPVPTPWADAPVLMLVQTADALGLGYEEAAVLYSGVSARDADSAEQALIAAGYPPRMINKHERPPPVLPAAALIGSAISLLLLIVTLSILMTRAQVQDMRAWAGQLTRIGVRRRWASRALLHQYLWVLGISLPVGFSVTLAAMWFTRLRLPQLEVTIPWLQITAVLCLIVVATLTGVVLATRNLTAADADDD